MHIVASRRWSREYPDAKASLPTQVPVYGIKITWTKVTTEDSSKWYRLTIIKGNVIFGCTIILSFDIQYNKWLFDLMCRVFSYTFIERFVFALIFLQCFFNWMIFIIWPYFGFSKPCGCCCCCCFLSNEVSS